MHRAAYTQLLHLVAVDLERGVRVVVAVVAVALLHLDLAVAVDRDKAGAVREPLRSCTFPMAVASSVSVAASAT